MVLKIEKLSDGDDGVSVADAENGEAVADPPVDNFDPPPSKKPRQQKDLGGNMPHRATTNLVCEGCGISDKDAPGSLLLFDDPEEDGKDKSSSIDIEKRYCAQCITGKKVRVFWPVDSQWYIACVEEYDVNSGEHLLRYPDGDTEWVRIGEDHTTNIGYKQYYSDLKTGESQGFQGTISNGGSFALSALDAHPSSQGLSDGEYVESLKKNPLQQLDTDRTASSLSSFGLNAAIGRQHSFHRDGDFQYNQANLPPFQILSPNYTHSFSSQKGDDTGMKPSQEHGERPDSDDHAVKKGPPGQYYPYGSRSESWERPYPHHAYRTHPHVYDSSRVPERIHHIYPYEHYPQFQRCGGSEKSEGRGENPLHYQMHPSYRSQHPPQNGIPHVTHWPSQRAHHYPPNYYNDPHHMYPYPMPPPSHSSEPPLISPATPDDNQVSHETQNETTETVLHQPPQLPPIFQTDKQKKAATKAWAKEEDEHLLEMVFQMKHPLKWSVIAQNLDTNRTGKQCRERYVNHLNPRLKSTEWTPMEDFVIWRLYSTIGTQWAKMSKVIPGRTDNGIKNRFHNLKRQLEREEESRIRAPRPDDYEGKVRVDWIRDIPAKLRTSIEELWSVERGIGKVAAATVNPKKNFTKEETEGDDFKSRFGPFETVTAPTQCLRCGLFIPSVQCGESICSKTRWCLSCTAVPMHMIGNVLRECLNLKKIRNGALLAGMENLMKDVRP